MTAAEVFVEILITSDLGTSLPDGSWRGFAQGERLQVSRDLADYLLRDAPGCVEIAGEVELESAPSDAPLLYEALTVALLLEEVAKRGGIEGVTTRSNKSQLIAALQAADATPRPAIVSDAPAAADSPAPVEASAGEVEGIELVVGYGASGMQVIVTAMQNVATGEITILVPDGGYSEDQENALASYSQEVEGLESVDIDEDVALLHGGAAEGLVFELPLVHEDTLTHWLIATGTPAEGLGELNRAELIDALRGE